MSVAKRKVFGAEFKAKVGLEAIRGVKTINQIAQEHGVHPAQYRAELKNNPVLFELKTISCRRNNTARSKSKCNIFHERMLHAKKLQTHHTG